MSAIHFSGHCSLRYAPAALILASACISQLVDAGDYDTGAYIDATITTNSSYDSIFVGVSSSLTITANVNVTSGDVTVYDSSALFVKNPSGILTIMDGSLYVGFYDVSNRVEVSNGGKIICYGDAFIGYNATSNRDWIAVTGGSVFNVAGQMYVGYTAAYGGDRVTVDGASHMSTQGCVIGYQSYTTQSNEGDYVNITGASRWTVDTGGIKLGYNPDVTSSSTNIANGNYLAISANSMVTSRGSIIVGGPYSKDNYISLSGVGSALSSQGNLIVGETDVRNHIDIGAGTSVHADGTLYIGKGLASGGGGGNWVSANGASASFTIGGDAHLGVFNSNNWLEVKNGASASIGGTLYMGEGNSCTNNAITVDSGSSLTTGAAYIGYSSTSYDSVTVDGSGSTWNANGIYVGYSAASCGLGVTDGAVVNAGAGPIYVGCTSGSTGYSVLVSGAGSRLVTTSTLSVGDKTNGNYNNYNYAGSFVVSAGGSISDKDGIFGNTGNLNQITITGTGSSDTVTGWTNTGDFTVGGSGSDNMFIVQYGADLTTAGTTRIGNSAAASYDMLILDGSGTTFTAGAVNVGVSGSSDSLSLTAGATATCSGDMRIGVNAGSTDNDVVVTGSGTSMTLAASTIYVGDAGSGTLTIKNAGHVTSAGGVLGVSGNGGYVELTGRGASDTSTYWTDTGTLTVGDGGSHNSVLVSDGADLTSGSTAYISYAQGADNNTVSVNDAGSTWTSAGLYVGYSGSHGTLQLTSGGKVTCGTVYVGYNSTSTGNSISISGSGSALNMGSNTLYVGNYGTGSLTVSAGGKITSSAGCVGQYSGGNTVTFTGSGASDTSTTWTNTGDLTVGQSGSGNTMSVSNGADIICSGYTFIGRAPGYSANSLTVSGTGSTLSSTNLLVGSYGSGGLTVSDGAVVSVTGTGSTGQIQVGAYAGSTGNTVSVTGAGAALTATSSVSVGAAGTGSLTIGNGGSLSCSGFTLGQATGGNSVTLIGTGASDTSTKLTDTNILTIGVSGADNTLLISNGADVTCTRLAMGGTRASTGNSITVSGAGSTLLDSGKLTLGDIGSGSITISGGALVAVDGVVTFGTASGNCIYLRNGYFAVKGDLTDASKASTLNTLLSGIRVYSELIGAYEGAHGSTCLDYYYASTFEAALGYTGSQYSGLAGYTVFTSVPEPSAFAICGGAAALALAALRKRKRAAKSARLSLKGV
ncbi:MAG: hypothetical protein WC360_04030 [Opitutales bacterium]|jgi:T5SS/PEP-CTERM-associated repeat protein